MPAAATAGRLYELSGDSWFGGLGFERRGTPNAAPAALASRDLPSLSGGYRWDERHSLSLQLVPGGRRDGLAQEVHLTFRTALGRDQVTLDLLSSTVFLPGGQAAPQRLGLSVSYDWPRYFVRLAYDPKANFLPQDSLKLSAGMRF